MFPGLSVTIFFAMSGESTESPCTVTDSTVATQRGSILIVTSAVRALSCTAIVSVICASA